MSTRSAEPPTGDGAVNQSTVSAVSLTFDSGSQSVLAVLASSSAPLKLDLPALQALLNEQGYGEFQISDSGMQALIKKASQSEECSVTIAYRRDAELKWAVQPDKMAVYLTAMPAYGGKKITRDWLLEELHAQGVVQKCIDDAALEGVVKAGQSKRLCVARGIEPEHGADSQFVSLVEEYKNLLGDYSAKDKVDFHQLHDFVVVEKGDVLMRRSPPTVGVTGVNVVGETLPAEPGSSVDFNPDVDGAVIDPDNPDQLIAAVKGHPILIENGVFVDPTLRLDAVDIQSGDIDFDGSVEVKGDVSSGFSLKASGNIYIHGMVEKATVRAGRDLTIVGGIAGEEQRDQNQKLIYKACVLAGGDIKAKFANLAYLDASGNIIIADFVLQSDISARGNIYLTHPGSKGCIIGGKTRARHEIVVNSLGSDANVPTVIRAGKITAKPKLEEELRQEYKHCMENCEKLEQVLKVSENPTHKAPANKEMIRKIKATLQSYEQKILRIKSIQARLNERKHAKSDAIVTVKGTIHPNVFIGIDSAGLHNHDSKTGCSFVREEHEVISR